jgi:hypothetical protein
MAITRATTSSVAQGPSTRKTISGGNDIILPGSYDAIATANGTGSSSTITFSSIPSIYKHLQLRWIARDGRAIAEDTMNIQFNGDTTSSYMRFHILEGSGSAVSAAAGATSHTSSILGYVAGTTAGTDVYGVGVTDILDYSNTNKNKTVRTLNGIDRNGAGYIVMWSGLWMKTDAINQISIITGTGTSWTTPTQFALYGIK